MNLKSFIIAGMGAFAFTAPAAADVAHLMPTPWQVTPGNGGFAATSVKVTDPTNCPLLVSALSELDINVDAQASAEVKVEIVNSVADGFDYTLGGYDNEGYELVVAPEGITIRAVKPVGVIRAAQTLMQLGLERKGDIPAVEIKDRPAFKVRGWMQDVGRSFLSVDELKRQIDLFSRFKINTFHWHLTDYTGWRLEIKKYPQLTSDKAITRYKGQFYTQEQAKEIMDYAAERGVTVIPEIDMPGHSHPFENAMGFGMQTTQGIAALKDILAEVAACFVSAPYIHIGGDEVTFDDQYIKDMIDYVHGRGKKVVIWNRYNRPAKQVDPSVIKCDMTTNWATSGTLSTGVPNIDMRYNYVNHFDVFADLVGIYKSSIFYVDKGNTDVAGTISGCWNDTKVPGEDEIVRMNNQYANVLASGERAWKGGGKQYIETGGVTLPVSGDEFEEFADWERRFLYHKNTTLSAAAHQIPYVKQTNVRWNITDQMPNGGNAATVLPPEQYIGAESVPSTFEVDGVNYAASPAAGAGIYLRHIWHGTVKGFYNNPQNNVTSYAWTYVYSPVEQDCGAFIEFYTYSRSGSEKMPPRGKWDRRGSRIWLNGTEIAAPEWQQPDANIAQDHDTQQLTNENFTNRPATAIHLKQGWNQVFMKLPHVNSGGTARDKWQFTFVVTDPEGNNALDGLVYSANKCPDTASETLMNLILQARAAVSAKVGTEVGMRATSALDQDLLAKADELEPTCSDSNVSAETRAAQIVELQALIDAFNAGIAAIDINLPSPDAYYYMYTPNRGSKYLTVNGNKVDGQAGASGFEAQWRFELRTDGKFNIRNRVNGRYIPTSVTGTMTTSAPSAGWEVKPGATDGLVIVASGTNQIHQGNSGMLNWGSGTNTTDDGCQYRFVYAEAYTGTADQLTSLIADIREQVADKVGNVPGQHVSTALDQDLLAKANEIEATLGSDMTEAQRAAQLEELQSLYAAFTGGVGSTDICLTPDANTYYYMYTPLRGSRYVTEADGGLTGLTGTPEKAWGWVFKARTDGKYDIINAASGSFITPPDAVDSRMLVADAAPASGWELKPAATDGLLIVVNGSAQFNQTNNAGQGFYVFNWGSGTNTTDTGCQYKFVYGGVANPESGINEAKIDKNLLTVVPGGIFASDKVSVYNLQGVKVAEGKGFISVVPGLYIVKSGSRIAKFKL